MLSHAGFLVHWLAILTKSLLINAQSRFLLLPHNKSLAKCAVIATSLPDIASALPCLCSCPTIVYLEALLSPFACALLASSAVW